MKRTIISVVVAGVAVAGALNIAAETAPDLNKMAANFKQNQQKLQGYTWQSDYTFKVNGVQQRFDVYRVRTIGGYQEKMQLKSEVAKEPVRRANGKKLSKKEREEAYDFVLNVKSQLDSYLNPMFAEKAVLSSTATTTGEILTLTSHNVVKTGDTVVILYEKSTLRGKSASVTTRIGDSPVSLEIEFGFLDYGPNYTASSTTTARWQEFDLEITTLNSHFEETPR